MKSYKFTKMHGCGNDYVYINCFDLDIKSPKPLAIKLSNRHTGVGSDGLVLILRSRTADAKMRMFNSDGSESGMCGNAIRCVAKYVYDNGLVKKRNMQIETLSGIKKIYLSTTSAKVDMGPAELRPEKIPVKLKGERIISKPVKIGGKKYAITCVSMGNPHAVVFCKNVDKIALHEIGPQFENSDIFPEKVNAEFIEVLSKNHLKMRVWERGTGETQACGTGTCAAAVAAVLNGHCSKNADIKVRLPGGQLTIKYTDETVYMTGNCVKVFEGVVEI
jgi:carbamoyl-phosphate synthase large subunit